MTVVAFVVVTSGLVAALLLFRPVGRYSPTWLRLRRAHRRVRSRLRRWHITR